MHVTSYSTGPNNRASSDTEGYIDTFNYNNNVVRQTHIIAYARLIISTDEQ